jgi:release factor glutamine methyltransferase
MPTAEGKAPRAADGNARQPGVDANADGAGHPDHDRLLAASGLPRTDARALLEAASGRSREWLAAHGDDPVAPDVRARFDALAARRRHGEPLAYLLGWREFRGRRFAVTPAVLVPRPETEELVDAALARLQDMASPRVLDLGTGSGAIAVSLALERPDADITATDASPDALAVATANAERLGAARVRWLQGDWWQALPAGVAPFDLVVSNPPYIAEADPHLDDPALRCEPRQALASGADGLEAIRRIVAEAPRWLAPQGWLLLEHGHDQGPAVAGLLREAGFTQVSTLADAAGLPRIGTGRRGHV